MADPRLVAMLAAQGPKALNNPVTRFALGLPSGTQGVEQAQPQQQVQSPESQSQPVQAQRQSTPYGIQEKLLARIRTVSDTGFAVPAAGSGILPGYALRPEVRKVFEGMGGVAGFDTNNMSPEEEKGLAFILDPNWVKERQQ
jgi:predicted naringenin-chalcone synthase